MFRNISIKTEENNSNIFEENTIPYPIFFQGEMACDFLIKKERIECADFL